MSNATRRLATLGGGAIAGLAYGLADVALLWVGDGLALDAADAPRLLGAAAVAGATAGLVLSLLVSPALSWLRRGGRRPVVAGVLTVFAGVMLYADATVYVNLYPWAHVLLGVAGLLGAVGAVGLVAGPRLGAVGLAVGLPLAVAGQWIGPLALGGQRLWQPLRQRTTVVGRIAALWPAPEVPAGIDPSRCAWPPAALAPADGGAEGASVLFITVDALRGDLAGPRLSRYMPKLAERLKEGAHFTRAYAAATRTAESTFSTFTGRWPHRLDFVSAGVDGDDRFREKGAGWSPKQAHRLPLHDRTPTLAELLSERGYDTVAPISYVFFLPGAGITRGFDQVLDGPYREHNRDGKGLTSGPLTEAAIGYLSTAPTRWFMWLHYTDPHNPYVAYNVPAGAPEHLRYQSELRRVDDAVEELLAALEAEGRLKRTLLVVAADHGEEFRDHGGRFHGTKVYEEQAWVPLVFAGPGVKPGVYDAPVSLVDVVPTVVDMLGLAVETPFDGRSLGAALRGQGAPPRMGAGVRPVLIQSELYGRRAAVVEGHLKLLEDLDEGVVELYDLATDRRERRSLVDERSEDVARLRCLLGAAGVERR